MILSEAKSLLTANPVFALLTDGQQNAAVDNAIQRIVSLRNSLNKEDYSIDTAGTATVITNILTSGTTAERLALALTPDDVGFQFFDTDLNSIYTWNGTEWV